MPRKEDNVPATLRAISVLEALVAADRPASLAELTGSSHLPKPTLYRMLGMLESARLVVREPAARRYAPGPRLAALKNNPDPAAALAGAMENVARECADPKEFLGCFIVNSLSEIAEINPAVTTLLHGMVRLKEEAFADCIRRAQGQGKIEKSYDAGEVARLLVALQFSMRAMAKSGGSIVNLSSVASRLGWSRVRP